MKIYIICFLKGFAGRYEKGYLVCDSSPSTASTMRPGVESSFLGTDLKYAPIFLKGALEKFKTCPASLDVRSQDTFSACH